MGIEVVRFTSTKEAREYADTCAVAADSGSTKESMDLENFEVHGERSAPSGLTEGERAAGAAEVRGQGIHPGNPVYDGLVRPYGFEVCGAKARNPG